MYEFTDWLYESRATPCHAQRTRNVFDQYCVPWIERVCECVSARVTKSYRFTIRRLSYLCVHDVYTKLSEPNESTRAAAAAAHSVKKEKDNIRIDDFNSVSIALPDSKLVNIVVFFFSSFACIFVCDINAHRDFSSASTIHFFSFVPLLLVLHARYEY